VTALLSPETSVAVAAIAGVETDLLISALHSLPAHLADDYKTWVRVAAALKGASNPALFYVFDSWSRQSDHYGGTADIWRSLDGGSPETLLRLAREHGWEPPDAVPRPEPPLKLTDELRLARHYLSLHSRDDVPTLRYYLGDWYQWEGCWSRIDAFADRLYKVCKRYIMDETAKLPSDATGKKPAAPQFGKAAVANVEMALRSEVSLSAAGWIDGRKGRYIAFRDKLLNLDAWLAGRVDLIEQTPSYFAPHALNYDCEHTDAEPSVLLAMLREQLSQSEIDCLQEFIGYGLTPETDIQRAVYLLGPPRSGKGTIERIERATVGEHNCASKSLKAFNSPHALEDLPGKTFLCISDQRSNDKVSAEALERLLGIIGQDVQSINPKNRPHYSAPLNCKVMIVSNVMLDFADDTGAALARFLFLQTRKSYAGKEDPALLQKILGERNAVTWWALRGLRRLLQNGRYTEPQNDLRNHFQRHNAPVQSFVENHCELSGEVQKDVLHDAFLDWCEAAQVPPMSKEDFCKRLYASYTNVRAKRANEGGSRSQRLCGVSLRVAA
jgi:putative DNA primase/helicase